ncbi:hypothetical protein [Siminovitchia fortis]|uniref:hypothetical protein n=1 Tax=Siminovitchia fortis TaxID=254758 RepID=UPI001C92F822|nr:hypothetical protein [Siminovitchia fortis]
MMEGNVNGKGADIVENGGGVLKMGKEGLGNVEVEGFGVKGSLVEELNQLGDDMGLLKLVE